MKLGSLARAKAEIPTCSMADIAFLLIIFFMVTTTFKAEQGLDIDLPRAEKAEKMPRKNVAHIWVGRDGYISIDDMRIEVEEVGRRMSVKHAQDPGIIVSILTDKDASYGVVADIFEQLKNAGVLRVSLGARRK